MFFGQDWCVASKSHMLQSPNANVAVCGALQGTPVEQWRMPVWLTVAVGVYPEPVIRVTDRIAGELLAPAGYVDSVFPADMTPAPGDGAAQEGETQQ